MLEKNVGYGGGTGLSPTVITTTKSWTLVISLPSRVHLINACPSTLSWEMIDGVERLGAAGFLSCQAKLRAVILGRTVKCDEYWRTPVLKKMSGVWVARELFRLRGH